MNDAALILVAMIGLALVVGGIALIYVPAAIIFAGAVLTVAAVRGDWEGSR